MGPWRPILDCMGVCVRVHTHQAVVDGWMPAVEKEEKKRKEKMVTDDTKIPKRPTPVIYRRERVSIIT